MRYEDDLRGLQDITGKTTALSPNPLNKPSEVFQFPPQRSPISPIASSSRMTNSIRGLSSSTAILTTPLGVRARLSSLGQNSPGRSIKYASSSSTITVQGPKQKPSVLQHMRPFPPSSSEGSDSEDEEAAKEEEADRKLEEQEALDQKLKDLQKIITGDALGLVSSSQSKAEGKEKSRDRGRIPPTQGQPRRYRADELSSRSQSISSASSPQGSIPSIPSPPPEARFESLARHLSSHKSPSPPVVSPRSAHGKSHPRYGPVGRRTLSSASEQESHGSSASSFSDLSGKFSSFLIRDNISDL